MAPQRLALTMGDPAGIGPEIILRLFEGRMAAAGGGGALEPGGGGSVPFVPVIVGETRLLEQVARRIGSPLRLQTVQSPAQAAGFQPGLAPVVEPQDFSFASDLVMGTVQGECGAAAWAYVRRAVSLIQQDEADALVTAPLNKEALRAAACPHQGHTEMLADLTKTSRVAMLLVGGGLRVALATIHEPLERVPRLLTRQGLLDRLRLMDEFIPWFWEVDASPAPGTRERTRPKARPRIAVTGLNPHAGEGGLFGDAEGAVIAPAVAAAQSEGIDAVGPLPADTVFHFHREGKYDAVLAMYHDQALIPVKTLDFHRCVNVTMGLPFIRASVGHGTAFDIAGKGTASSSSLEAALQTAALLAWNRRRDGR
ncbi:MAG TPA: 4-hydroxythreonine-4-phosphate dehydrogenase PdxA [Sumerlaeia bacterium]|nr:4-hydroxythreonine-4-phosphate dehydrogenase PdxA [Sumerlaeia bacterium]